MKKLFLICVCLFSISTLYGQDIHYSQFYNSPLTLNPAMTGKTDGSYRVSANYRNQWFGVSSGGATYSTPSLSFEKPFRVGENDVIGAGILLLNDQSSGGNLSNFSAMLSAAYHKALDRNGSHYITVGVQGGYTQKRLDYANLKFASQYEDVGGGWQHNPNLNSLEQFSPDNNVDNFDLQAGILWNSTFADKYTVYAGFAMFHILEPEQNFVDGDDIALPRRNVIHGGLDLALSQKFSLLPSVIYMQQASAEQTNFGMAGAFHFGDDAAFYVGGYYRLNDAIIPYAAFDFKGFRLGLSYDVTVSELNQSNGSIEVSLSYRGRAVPLPEATPDLFAPRF